MTKSFASLFAKLETSPTYQAEKLAVAFLAELNVQMHSKQVSNAELARRMDVSPAYITKIFRGPSNLSIETLAKLAVALDCVVHLHLAKAAATVRWFDVFNETQNIHPVGATERFDFSRVLDQLQLVQQLTSNDEKFALAA